MMNNPNYTTAPASPGYEGLYHAGAELSIAETAARMNELERDNAGLLALLREIDYAEPARAEWLLAHAREQAHPGRELMARTLEEVVTLHIALDAAHQHVGALTKELDTAIVWIEERGNPSEVYASTAAEIVPQFHATLGLDRAWLQREA